MSISHFAQWTIYNNLCFSQTVNGNWQSINFPMQHSNWIENTTGSLQDSAWLLWPVLMCWQPLHVTAASDGCSAFAFSFIQPLCNARNPHCDFQDFSLPKKSPPLCLVQCYDCCFLLLFYKKKTKHPFCDLTQALTTCAAEVQMLPGPAVHPLCQKFISQSRVSRREHTPSPQQPQGKAQLQLKLVWPWLFNDRQQFWLINDHID